MGRKPTTGVTKPTQFRLGDDVLAAIDELAERFGGVTRTQAVRLAVWKTLDLARRAGKPKTRKGGAK